MQIKNPADHNYYKLKFMKRAWNYNFCIIGIAILVYFMCKIYESYATLIIYTFDISLVIYLIAIFRYKNRIVAVMKDFEVIYDKNEKKQL